MIYSSRCENKVESADVKGNQRSAKKDHAGVSRDVL